MTTPARSAQIAQTTPTGAAIAEKVAQAYDFGEVRSYELLRRSFNHVYGLQFADGRHAVARLSADRPRGAPNIGYETALLVHLKVRDVPVAGALAARDGAHAVAMDLPEGERPLILFEHLDGDVPGDVLPDVEATGRGLALLHEAAQDYHGPASRYTLELPDLLHASLERLHAAPTMTDALRPEFSAIARALEARIAAMPALTRVHGHGDCHGMNNFVTEGLDGVRVASFFDFDDAGPGWLAYDLCVYLWAMHPRTAGGTLDVTSLARWRSYLAGYRSARPLPSADVDAIAAFMAVRQFWLMGEHAGRIAVWGTQSMPTSWLRTQVTMLTAWAELQTPE